MGPTIEALYAHWLLDDDNCFRLEVVIHCEFNIVVFDIGEKCVSCERFQKYE